MQQRVLAVGGALVVEPGQALLVAAVADRDVHGAALVQVVVFTAGSRGASSGNFAGPPACTARSCKRANFVIMFTPMKTSPHDREV